MQDIFLKLWDRPGFGLWREIVEDWDERSLDADSLEGWQISKLLHLSFLGQPFPRRFVLVWKRRNSILADQLKEDGCPGT